MLQGTVLFWKALSNHHLRFLVALCRLIYRAYIYIYVHIYIFIYIHIHTNNLLCKHMLISKPWKHFKKEIITTAVHILSLVLFIQSKTIQSICVKLLTCFSI